MSKRCTVIAFQYKYFKQKAHILLVPIIVCDLYTIVHSPISAIQHSTVDMAGQFDLFYSDLWSTLNSTWLFRIAAVTTFKVMPRNPFVAQSSIYFCNWHKHLRYTIISCKYYYIKQSRALICLNSNNSFSFDGLDDMPVVPVSLNI